MRRLRSGVATNHFVQRESSNEGVNDNDVPRSAASVGLAAREWEELSTRSSGASVQAPPQHTEQYDEELG